MSTPDGRKERREVAVCHKTFSLTPSARHVCIICQEDIRDKFPNDKDLSRKKRLFTDDNQKTAICHDLEKYLRKTLDPFKDYKAICSSCAKTVRSTIKKEEENSMKVEEGRQYITEHLLRSRSSIRHIPAADEPPLKKQLLFTSDETFCQITITDGHEEDQFEIPSTRKNLYMAICKGNVQAVMHELKKHFPEYLSNFIQDDLAGTIHKEVSNICGKSVTSFQLQDIEELKEKTLLRQFQELQKHAPVLTDLLLSVAQNPRADARNKKKTTEKVIPTVVNALGSLFFARSQKMNTVPTRNMLILSRGRADKNCIQRFQKLNISLSHSSSLRKQYEATIDLEFSVRQHASLLLEHALSLREKFASAFEIDSTIPISIDNEENYLTLFSINADESFLEEGALNPNVELINCSMSTISEHSNEKSSASSASDIMPVIESLDHLDITIDEPENQNVPRESKGEVRSYNEPTFHPKYVFVGDNVDVNIKPRYYSRTSSNKDLHMYNLIAVLNRVPIPQYLIGVKAPQYKLLHDTPLNFFLPTQEDEINLKEEMKILISRDLAKYVDSLSWMKKYVKKHIPHNYTNETSQVSQVYPLGIINENETKSDGMIRIMQQQHRLVPGHDTNSLVRMLSVGDLLTVERQQNAQKDMRKASSLSKQLLGLIPALADFHSYGNFMEVIWHILYFAGSSGDKGTLFQARNFLNAKAVPGSPMKDLNACEDLLFLFSDALIIAAVKQYEKSHNIKESGNEDDDKQLMDTILTDLVETFMTPQGSPEGKLTNETLECPYCCKRFKLMVKLRNHVKCHKGEQIKSKSDNVLNYSRNALALSYIAKDFVDARKHGDGERIIRLYKFLLLYYKIDSRHKYAFQTLHLLAQISYLLPPSLSFELKWNRFVNTKGHVDSNVELDRHLKHQNKYVKLEFERCQGKLTEKSIARSGRSYNVVQSVMDLVDDELGVVKPSGQEGQNIRCN